MTRVVISTILGVSLVGNSAPTVSSLGIITDATSAHVSEGSASAGTTVYEGDRLITDKTGGLGIKSKGMALRLEAETSVTLERAANSQGIWVELATGTIVFSSTQASAVEVHADGAVIRPLADTPTIAHIRVAGPEELRIYARRGALEFSYGGEREEISEAGCYRVLLDQEVDTRPNEADTGGTDASPPKRKPFQAHRPFVMIVIAVGAAVAAGLRHHPHPHPHESPEEP
jgi:hypothetical protein